jgi:hypothetical protein
MNSSFSPARLSSKQYSVNVVASAAPTPISPAFPRKTAQVPASENTRMRTNIGISSNVFDSRLGTQADIDLGLMYSNGVRYQYLNFKAGTTGCSAIIPDSVIDVVDQTINGPVYTQETLSGGTLIYAYIGNAVVPPQPVSITPFCTGLSPSKLPPGIRGNINC